MKLKKVSTVIGTVVVSSDNMVGVLATDLRMFWVNVNEQKGVVNERLKCGDVVCVTVDTVSAIKPVVLNVTKEGSHADGDNLPTE